MRAADIRLLRNRNLLIITPETVAMIDFEGGWRALPEELANAVRAVARADDDDPQAPRRSTPSAPRPLSEPIDRLAAIAARFKKST